MDECTPAEQRFNALADQSGVFEVDPYLVELYLVKVFYRIHLIYPMD